MEQAWEEWKEDTETVFYNKMYDNFTVEFNNRHIILWWVQDNWKGNHLKGSSSLPLVHRFSIILGMERCTVKTTDPAWPSLTVAATLPRLHLHLNENKVVTLKHIMARMLGPDYGGTVDAGKQT